MNDETLEKLKLVDAGELAEALFGLGLWQSEAKAIVVRLTGAVDERREWFERELRELNKGAWELDPEEDSRLGARIEEMLVLLESCEYEPLVSLQKVAEIFEADDAISRLCHDLPGWVFAGAAAELFLKLAARVSDKEAVQAIVDRLGRSNEFGLRDRLLEGSGEALKEGR